tara:strand:+ start:264 stop:593 length:330 start_codon:yes stop_codon:yes gene_type:complete
MGIFIGKHNRRSTSWIGRFDPTNQQDMREYDIVKSIVKIVNANSREKFRVEKKGRKPKHGFIYGGNPKGGIKNATLWDVYIWKRHDVSIPNGLSWAESRYPDPTWSEYS